MKNIKLLGSSLALATVLSLAGCGEDDSSSSGTAIAFPSNSAKAEPTLANGKEVANVVATNNIVGLPIPDGLQDSNAINTTLIALKSSEILKNQITQEPNYTEEISKENCSHGGTVTTTISASLTSTKGTYTTKYAQCNDGENLLDGSIEYSVSILDYANDKLDSMHVYFITDFSMKDLSSAKTANIKKNSNFTLQTLGKKLKLTVSLQATEGNNYYGQENAVYYIYDNDNSNMTYIYQTAGRIYINDLKEYVDYDTAYDMSQTPFAYNSTGNIVGGEARYLMSSNGKVKIIVESQDNVVTYVDADGDGHYELN